MLTYPNIDPIALSLGTWHLFGQVFQPAIHWYGITYLAGFLGAYWCMYLRGRKPGGGWTAEQLQDLLFYGALGVVFGGRTGYMLFYDWQEFSAHPQTFFFVWNGGMSFHGGLVGVLVAMWLYGRRQGRRFFDLTDFIAPVVPIGLGAWRGSGERWRNRQVQPGRHRDARRGRAGRVRPLPRAGASMADGVSLAAGDRHAHLGARAGGRRGGQLPGQGRVQKAEAVDVARPFGQPEQGSQRHDQVSRAPLMRLSGRGQTGPRAGAAGIGAGAVIAVIVEIAAVAGVAAIIGFVVVIAVPAAVAVLIGHATAVALGARAFTRVSLVASAVARAGGCRGNRASRVRPPRIRPARAGVVVWPFSGRRSAHWPARR